MQGRLIEIIAKNCKRLGKTVDDILEVVRITPSEKLTAKSEVSARLMYFMTDWQEVQGTKKIQLENQIAKEESWVRFDPEHLRRVLFNLLDNAKRHASDRPRAICVRTNHLINRYELSVWSDGAPLSDEVKAHLFEPFSSSQSRSSGLGLYICRELCARHGAQISYQRTSDGALHTSGNEFIVSMLIVSPD